MKNNLHLNVLIFCCTLFLAAFSIQTNAQVTVGPADFVPGQATQFIVPAGVSEITIVGIGGSGGEGIDDGSEITPVAVGGCGAQVTGTFEVFPGDVLSVIVGAGGENGVNGVGDGGGGGGTAVINMTTNTVLLVAGGGGGGSVPNTGIVYNGENGIAANGSLGAGGAGGEVGAGGGGATSGGTNSGNTNALGGAAGNPNGGAGGNGSAVENSPPGGNGGGGNGGFGYGGGGGANNNGAGGGGGAIGGAGGMNASPNGKGGGSYANVDLGMDFNFGPINCTSGMNGSVVLSFVPSPVPTLGQWGLILLALLTTILGIVFIKVRKTKLA